MLIIGHQEVADLLAGRERELIETVRSAYLLHHQGKSAVPHSLFLRFPDNDADRIIALPAYVGGQRPAAGVKWISSFPGNLALDLPRASAAIVLNSLDTGRPEALIEASLISASRTAASAALAAELLVGDADPVGVTLIGCGVINLAILRFLSAVFPAISEVVVYDALPQRAAGFAESCRAVLPAGRVTVARRLDSALAAHPLVSLATTAGSPHTDLSACAPGTVLLHISLRDIEPVTISRQHNVVDDADHVCRERTSLHLAETLTGSRSFIDATIGELIAANTRRQLDPTRLVIFSPFGLGALDISLADSVRCMAEQAGLGTRIPHFLPGHLVPAGTH